MAEGEQPHQRMSLVCAATELISDYINNFEDRSEPVIRLNSSNELKEVPYAPVPSAGLFHPLGG